MAYVATVSSSIVFVSELERSVAFYHDVFGCEVSVRSESAVLLLAPEGFQLYLFAKGSGTEHPFGGIGVHHLLWATDSAEGLEHFEQLLKDHGRYSDTHTTGGVRFVEGLDPDGIRVVIAHPSPKQQPRSVLDSRFYS